MQICFLRHVPSGGFLGLPAGPCENDPGFRKSAAGFFLQFSLQIPLEKTLFGRSPVQLILVALSLYPFGPKEGGLFPAPQALGSGLLRLPGFDSGVWAPPGLNLGVVGLLGPEAFLLAPAPGKFFTMQGFVFALCAFGQKQTIGLVSNLSLIHI